MRMTILSIILFLLLSGNTGITQVPGMQTGGIIQEITFRNGELPPNLYSKITGDIKNSVLQYRLPEKYSLVRTYPLIVYVPGFHGNPGGNIQNAINIADNRDCITASLPLFKKNIDRTEPGYGIVIGFSDYTVLAAAYEKMLTALFERIPNIDRQRSAMAGFSNGAIAIAVLVSSHNEFILEKFHSFCLVDHGMFHLADLQKSPTIHRRFLILSGDKDEPGRELKIRGAQLVQDSYRSLGCDIESRILPDTGHELTPACKKEIGMWIFSNR